MPDARPPPFGESSGMASMSDEKSPIVREAHELERIANAGGSSLTPLILLGEAWVVCAIAVLVLLALAVLAYRLAT